VLEIVIPIVLVVVVGILAMCGIRLLKRRKAERKAMFEAYWEREELKNRGNILGRRAERSNTNDSEKIINTNLNDSKKVVKR
jgi:predicted Holliday junction resolvase-like endonuclease